jgi:Site-specific recombinase XerC
VLVALPSRSDLSASASLFDHELEAGNRAPKTRITYRQSIDTLEAFLATREHSLNVDAITKRDIQDYFIEERRRGMTETTVLIRFRSLRPFFNFLVREGEIPTSPMAGMPQPTVRDAPPPTIPDADLAKLFRACSGPLFEDRRDVAIIALFTDSGIRLGEMNDLLVTDLDLDRKEADVTGKTGKRIVPYGSQTRRHIERYLRLRARHRDADLPFLWLGMKGRLGYYGIGEMLARRARQAGLVDHKGHPTIRPHLFRHTFSHNYLAEGPDGEDAGSELDLQQLGGWKDLATVAKYGRSAASARARRNYDRHSLVDRLNRATNPKRYKLRGKGSV